MFRKVELKWCKLCVLPSTRPNINFNKSEICSACLSSKEKKKIIDWKSRELEFIKVVKRVKKKKCDYDCLIPVSGGKDSTWQVITALKYNLKPLCVTWKTPVRSKIGIQNLENLIKLGVDHYDVTINPDVEKYFCYQTFVKFGSPAIPMHMALHSIPLNIAEKFKIPLILWGENSAFEYGGSNKKLKGKRLDNKWREKYGVYPNLSLKKFVNKKISLRDLNIYKVQKNIKNTEELFLGYFFKWDPVKIFNIVKNFNFKSLSKPKIGFYNFADIDDNFIITIHHWMKWYKFGFTRVFDNLSLEIRNGRISRQKAIQVIRNSGFKPTKEIKEFCNYININEKKFFKICENFRNKDIWKYNIRKRKWILENSIFKDYENKNKK